MFHMYSVAKCNIMRPYTAMLSFDGNLKFPNYTKFPLKLLNALKSVYFAHKPFKFPVIGGCLW